MLQDDFPALWQFLGGYLNQDWDLDYETPDEALKAFVSGEQALAPQLESEIDSALKLATTDEALARLLVDFGCGYFPASAGEGAREWLSRLGAQARSLARSQT